MALIRLDDQTVPVEGPAAEHRPIPCHRCGVCCERWQPLLSAADAARLAGFLGMAVGRFLGEYTGSYPFDDEQRLLRQSEGRCVFLRFAAEGGAVRAACAVHPARPRVCRDWAAGLDRKECVQGLTRFSTDGTVALNVLYPQPDDRWRFRAALAGWPCAAGPAGSGTEAGTDADGRA